MRKVILGGLALTIVVTTGCAGSSPFGVHSSPNGYFSLSMQGDREGMSAFYEGENAKIIHHRMPETELTRSPYYNNRLKELADKVKGFFGKDVPPMKKPLPAYNNVEGS